MNISNMYMLLLFMGVREQAGDHEQGEAVWVDGWKLEEGS